MGYGHPYAEEAREQWGQLPPYSGNYGGSAPRTKYSCNDNNWKMIVTIQISEIFVLHIEGGMATHNVAPVPKIIFLRL